MAQPMGQKAQAAKQAHEGVFYRKTNGIQKIPEWPLQK